MAQSQESIRDRVLNLTPQQIDDLFWEEYKPLYEQRPVDIDTFLDSPRFMGAHFNNPRTGKSGVYPFWRERLREIYPSPYYNRYNEVLVMLGIGNGKSTVANISCLYEIYKVLCMKDPQSYYGLLKDTPIVFVVLSANKYIAENVNWPQLKAAFEDSEWFTEHCPIVTDGKKVALDKDNRVTLPKNLAIQLGSSERHALGTAVIWGIVDEANFQSSSSAQAYNSYNAIAQRRSSRFQQAAEVPGVLWIVSSPKSDLDFVAQRMESQSKARETLIIKDIPSWEIKPDRGRSGETFKVFVGDTTTDPKLITVGEDTSNLNPNKILDVPIEFKSNFEKDLIKAIMDIAGRSSVSDFAIFPNAGHLKSLARIKNRINSSVVKVTMTGADEIYDSVDRVYFNDPPHKNCNRYIHIDIGLKGDRFALCSTYSFKLPKEDEAPVVRPRPSGDGDWGVFLNKGQEAPEILDNGISSERMYVCEFILFVKNAERDKEVPLVKVARFLRWLKLIGYPVKLVSYDLLGRGMFAQVVGQDFPTKYFSVDRDKEAYMTLKKGMSEDLVIFPDNEILIKELRQLRDVGRKIDHPTNTGYDHNGDPIFSKDGADALCGSVYQAMADPDKETFNTSLFFSGDDSEEDLDPLSMDNLKNQMRDQMNSSIYDFFL